MGMKYKDPSTGQLKELSLKAADTLPIGAVIAYSGSNEPSGWLICDGRAISRTNYSNLFNVIGTTYGAGDGSTTFNLPDYRDKVPVGLDSNDSDFDTLGKTGGEKEHKLIVNEIPSHNHNATVAGKTAWGGQSSKAFEAGGAGYAPSGGVAGIGISKTGNDQPHNNLQPYIVTNYIIKAEKSVGVLGKILNLFSNSDKDTYSCDYLNNNDTYSTDEIKTNKRWIDGKPIYRKVVNTGILPNTNSIAIPHNISNIDNILSTKGWAYRSTDRIFLNLPSATYDKTAISCYSSKTNIIIVTYNDRSTFKVSYVTVEYTKTTD